MMNGRAVLLLALWTLPLARPAAQAPGFAEITHPLAGAAVSGVVTLEGTANHPSFDHFDLAFTYQADTTGTWFPIVDEDRSRVVEGRLAVWDTTGISDGEYMLRLRVWPVEGEPLVATINTVRVRNYTSIETPTAGPVLATPALTATVPPATSTPTTLPTILPAAPEPGQRVGSVLIAGGIVAAVALAATGGYAGWRATSRSNWGSARAVRRAERRRRSRRSP